MRCLEDPTLIRMECVRDPTSTRDALDHVIMWYESILNNMFEWFAHLTSHISQPLPIPWGVYVTINNSGRATS